MDANPGPADLQEPSAGPADGSRQSFPLRLFNDTILWDTAPDAIVVVDPLGTIAAVNPAVEEMLDYRPEQLLGQKIEKLIPARFHNHARLREGFQANPVSRPMKGRRFFAQRRDGTELEVDIELGRRTGDGDLEGFVIVWLRDVSEREKFLKDLTRVEDEAASRARSRFLANISHEFRTPLNAILGLQQLILQKGDLQESDARNLDMALQSSMQLLDLLNNILEIARIESEELVVEECRFNLESLRQSIDTMFRSQAEKNKLEYSVRTTSQLPEYIVGDEHKIRQILIHLVSNAFKFTAKGEIRVTFAREGRENLLIEVADTGIGVAADRLVTLFEPFQQMQRENNQGEGSGLGLSICKNYVAAMGGSISVDSEENKGACFRLILPVLADEDSGQETPRDIPEAPDQDETIRVLVVDDSDSNRNVLGQLLCGAGYEFFEARDGIEAIEMAEAHHPQVILMDLQMPRMDGYEATREIKARMETIIVAVSANVFDADIKKAEESGVSGFIKKPFRLGMILDEIEKQLDSGGVTGERDENTDLSFGALSQKQRSELHEVLLRADPYEFRRLIESYGVLDHDTMDGMIELLNSYQYDRLLGMLSV